MKHDYTDLKPKGEPSHTVIHHYEEDQTELERWLRGLLKKGPGYWAGVVGAIVGAVALVWLLARTGGGDPRAAKAWTGLIEARSADQQAEIAEEYPNTKAAPWALLRAAAENYDDGVERLATSQDAARPLLAKAQEQFEAVLPKVPKDSLQARRAAFGLARTLEVRNEPTKAIAQYDTVAQTYAGTEEARQAQKLADALRAELKKPEAERFYTKLYAYKAPEMTLPPGGSSTIPSLMNPSAAGTSILDRLIDPDSKGALPPLPGDQEKGKADLPGDVFTPEVKAAPKATPPAVPETPKAPPADPGGGILPPPVDPKP